MTPKAAAASTQEPATTPMINSSNDLVDRPLEAEEEAVSPATTVDALRDLDARGVCEVRGRGVAVPVELAHPPPADPAPLPLPLPAPLSDEGSGEGEGWGEGVVEAPSEGDAVACRLGLGVRDREGEGTALGSDDTFLITNWSSTVPVASTNVPVSTFPTMSSTNDPATLAPWRVPGGMGTLAGCISPNVCEPEFWPADPVMTDTWPRFGFTPRGFRKGFAALPFPYGTTYDVDHVLDLP